MVTYSPKAVYAFPIKVFSPQGSEVLRNYVKFKKKVFKQKLT